MQALLRTVVSKKANITCDFAEDLPLVKADATQVRQIVMNLITNASDALGENAGDISIRTNQMIADHEYLEQAYLAESLDGGLYVYLEVQDSGCGMDFETQAKIFDPFFTTKVKGRGLGLAAVLGLVRRHFGALRVESRPGLGSIFRVLFPACAAVELAEEDLTVAFDGFCGSGKVLVIDDEEIVRTVAKEMLEGVGYEVLLAANGAEGIQIFQADSESILAVILDMTMPDMNGVEVFRELRQCKPEAKVIISSGYSEHDMLKLFRDGAAAGFLQKPYMPKMLISKIREVIEG